MMQTEYKLSGRVLCDAEYDTRIKIRTPNEKVTVKYRVYFTETTKEILTKFGIPDESIYFKPLAKANLALLNEHREGLAFLQMIEESENIEFAVDIYPLKTVSLSKNELIKVIKMEISAIEAVLI